MLSLIWSWFDELVKEDGIGVLVATAYLDEADRCDQVILRRWKMPLSPRITISSGRIHEATMTERVSRCMLQIVTEF